MTVAELVAKITLDTKEYDSKLQGATGKLSSFGSKASGSFGKITKLAAGAMAGASAAVVGFGATSIKTGMSFDKSMSQVAATMGTTTDKIDNLRSFAQKMGRETQFSATQAADALNYMALAGYDSEKSMKMLPNVLNLAAAGGMDLARASDMVTDASSALGLSESQTVAMVDQMAEAASKSNTSVEQLGEAMLTVGGTAKVMKGGTQELSTALGLLADNGIKGSEGGTALRNILSGIQGAKFEKSFGALGVEAYDAQGKMRSLKDIVSDMGEAMKGMTDEQKTDLINSTFNQRDLKSVNALLGTSSERWDELSKSIGKSAGAAEKMAETQMDNLAGDITYFKSALEGAQIAISDGLSPSLRDFVQEGTEGMSSFAEAIQSGDLSGAMQIAGQTIANLATIAVSKIPDIVQAGGQLLLGIGQGFVEQAPMLTSLIMDTLSNAFGALGSMDLSGVDVVGTVTSIIEGLVTGFTTLSPKAVQAATNLINQVGNGMVQGIPSLLSNVLPMLLTLSEQLKANASTMIDAGLQLILKMGQGIANAIPTIVTYVPQIVENIANIINDNAPKVLMAGFQLIVTLGKGIVQAIPTIVASVPKIVSAIFAVWSAVSWVSLGAKAANMIKNGINAAKTAIPNALKTAGRNAINAFKSINWASVGKAAITLLKGGITGAANLIPTALKAAGKLAMNAFKAINWASVGKAVVTGIARGIAGAAGIIANAARNAAKRAFDAAKSFLGIHSPSKLFRDEVGFRIGEGMALGIKNSEKVVVGAMNKLDSNLANMPVVEVSSYADTPIAQAPNTPIFEQSDRTGKSYVFNITNHVDGAENPEDFANRLVRQMQMQVRMA